MEPERARIRWDEEGIREHDATRGQKTKIDEPKTPYHYYEEPDEDQPVELDEGHLQEELEKVRKKQEFLEKRRAHYDEFQRVRQMRSRPEDEEEDT
jgi:protein phosphatase inhibitor 2